MKHEFRVERICLVCGSKFSKQVCRCKITKHDFCNRYCFQKFKKDPAKYENVRKQSLIRKVSINIGGKHESITES